jgi:hypothetical protein
LTLTIETETEKQDLSRVGRSGQHPDFASANESSGIFRFTQRVDTIEVGHQVAPSFQSCYQQSVVAQAVRLIRYLDPDVVVRRDNEQDTG